VSTEEQVRAIGAKTIAYEKSIRRGTHAGLRRADFFNTAGYVDVRDQMTHWARNLPAGWTAGRFLYSDDKKPYRTPGPDAAHVVSAMNRGAALIAHVGHGSEHGWFKSFSTRDLAQLTDADRLPIVISVGCSTACFAPLPPYDGYVDAVGKEHAGTNHKEVFHAPPPAPSPYQTGKYNPTGLGEQMLKHASTGSVVYIGCNTGAQPCAITLLEGFLAALHNSHEPIVGDCWASAIRYYYDKEHLATLKPNNDWYPPSIFYQGMKFMFFGDPTLPFARPEKKPPTPPAAR
jgi:Peptidase family C25